MTSKKSIKISLMLISLIFILSLGISAVSASSTLADNSTIYVGTNGNDDYDGLSDVYNSTTKSGPKATIKNATGTVSVNGTVHIANGIYNESGIVLDKSMNIIGAGETKTIVNGGHFLSIFTVDGFSDPTINVTISDLTLTNGTAIYGFIDGGMICQWGGAIYSSGGTVNVNNVTFTNNTGAYDGGVIYSFNGGIVNVNDCKFYNNTLPNGNGGVICNNGGTLTIINSTFSNNTATDSGAGNGGVIYNQYGTATITGCTFSNNTAAGNGGVIYNMWGTTAITGSTFSNNAAEGNGGAVYNDNGLMHITGCEFTGNNVTIAFPNQKYGGAIYNSCGTLSVADSTFTNNTAYYGGAICDDNGLVTIDNSKFNKNTAANYGAGGAICVYYSGGTVNITKSNFTENIGTGNAGAICSYAGTLTVDDSIFTKNNAGHTGYGGAILTQAVTKVTNSIFINNTCDYAGTIASLSESLDVANCTFLNNTAGSYGGAIYGAGTSLTVNNCTIMGNSAKYGGGGIYNQAQLTAHYNRIVNNTAKYGNGLYTFGTADAEYNWWGTNNPTSVVFGSTGTDIYGLNLPSWLVLNISTNSSTTPIGGNVTATAVLQQKNADGSYSSVGDNMPAGIPVTFSGVKGTVKTTSTVLVSGEAKTVFTASNAGAASVSATVDNQTVTAQLTVDKSTSNISISDMNGTNKNSTNLNATLTDEKGNPIAGQKVTFSVNGTDIGSATTNSKGIASLDYTPASSGKFTVTASFSGSDDYLSSTSNGTLTVAPSAYLYLKVTSSKSNLSVGETSLLKYKLGNSGSDTAYNVTVSFAIPDGLEFVTASVDVGNWTYNSTTRSLIWTLDSVPVGDPYLNITVKPLASGSYTVVPTITSATYNGNTNGLPSITVSAPSQNGGNGSSTGNNSVNSVKAVSTTTKTMPLQHTGMPLAGLLMGILAVLGGAILPRKK